MNYIDNDRFHALFHHRQRNRDEIIISLSAICHRFAQTIGNCDYSLREELAQEALLCCISKIHSYDIRMKTAFSYFTQIAKHAMFWELKKLKLKSKLLRTYAISKGFRPVEPEHYASMEKSPRNRRSRINDMKDEARKLHAGEYKAEFVRKLVDHAVRGVRGRPLTIKNAEYFVRFHCKDFNFPAFGSED